MNKKWLVVGASALMACSLAACSNGDKTVVSMKGGKITEEQYYDAMKQTSAGKQTLETMILNKCLEEEYGNKVSSKEVNAQFNKYKKQYGSSFDTVLQQNQLTEATFKKNIRTNLLLEAALKANKKITHKDLEEQWKDYQPKVTVQEILVSKKSDAEDIINKLKQDNSEKNFANLAKQYSQDSSSKNDGGKIPPFNNQNTSLDPAFEQAAFKLKNNEFTQEPVKGQDGYFVIRMINNPGKGKMADHKKELKNQIYANWMQNQSVMNDVITKVLKQGDVSIKDKDLQNILSNYLSTSSSSLSTSSSNK
ncbi:MAG: peptidylprolyl isomerase [Candidatus Paralactobacillus gallistercoris]|uniref:Foldase protein PrsA n=1 Tax=Candidatus Paralactobacillus gallistercoris TaxID=2838724 RepID=A0A948X0R2_9LACO|nr:peptidylprolyl isomerase [Candidatus Paralactobacillus gallistercoris]